MKNFIRDGFSFRQLQRDHGRAAWAVYPKGERCHWSRRASISTASDGVTFVVAANGQEIDARPTFEQAVELALSFAKQWRR